ncbi:MAG: hypothetical protein KatS3mg131_0381 [Candidatus Tectimicrobiota bacterium]|nr:MAG: hypothetical protein KatS3mg131_0381 [Candidatus Tectomicrobia bacterium]
MRLTRWTTGFLWLLGLGLLGVLLVRHGRQDLSDGLRALGWWLWPWLLLEAVPSFLHAVGWAACFAGLRPPLRLWQLYLVRQAGMAINQLTPTATLGGELARALLLRTALPAAQAVAPVVIGKASVTLAQTLYLAVGVGYLAQQLLLPLELLLPAGLALAGIALGLAGFLLSQRGRLFSRLLRRLGQRRDGAWGERLTPSLEAVDAQLLRYYRRHPWRLWRSCAWHLLAFASEGLKTYVLLRLLLGAAAPALPQAFAIAVAVAALDQVFFFVPARLGTLEGVRLAVLSALGIAQAYGLAFGLVARVEQLVWSALGLLAYGLCTRFPALLRPVRRRGA